jgi:hypothetical protein
MDCTAPAQTSFEIRRGGSVVRIVATDASGRFVVALEPGSYVLVQEKGLPSLNPLTVRVRPGSFTTLRLMFDSGIR